MAFADTIRRLRFGSSTPTKAEQQASMSFDVRRFSRTTGKARPSNISRIQQGLVSAIPGGAIASRGSKIAQSARGIYERVLGNPLGAGGIKGFGSRIVGRTLGGATIGAGVAFTESAITGNPLDISPRRLGFGALGFGLGGPIGAIAGTLFGGSQKIGEAIQGGMSRMPKFQDLPLPSTPREAGEDLNEIIKSLGAGASQFGSGLMGAPSSTFGVSVSPSLSAGGGGMDLSMLIMLLLGGGAGGYLLGRKKRKKRKSKKGRRVRK